MAPSYHKAAMESKQEIFPSKLSQTRTVHSCWDLRPGLPEQCRPHQGNSWIPICRLLIIEVMDVSPLKSRVFAVCPGAIMPAVEE